MLHSRCTNYPTQKKQFYSSIRDWYCINSTSSIMINGFSGPSDLAFILLLKHAHQGVLSSERHSRHFQLNMVQSSWCSSSTPFVMLERVLQPSCSADSDVKLHSCDQRTVYLHGRRGNISSVCSTSIILQVTETIVLSKVHWFLSEASKIED